MSGIWVAAPWWRRLWWRVSGFYRNDGGPWYRRLYMRVRYRGWYL